MKKILPVAILFSLLLFPFFGFTQEIKGVAIYKTSRKMDELKVNDGKNKELEEQLRKQLEKQFQKEYTLLFTANETLYKQNESLETPSPSTANNGIEIKIAGNTNVLFYNYKEKRYVKDSEIFGKAFLIKDSIPTTNWELTKESKNIGEYTCFKATRSQEYTSQIFTDDNKLEEITKTKIITAWFTPQIPIAGGPSNYNGLPGLILEVNDGSETIICSKITINPQKGIKIVEPTKGKELSQENFDEIETKKNKEMMEQFQSNRKGDKGNSFTIQIGG